MHFLLVLTNGVFPACRPLLSSETGPRLAQPTDRTRCLALVVGGTILALPPVVSVHPIATLVPVAMIPGPSVVALL